MSVRTTIVYDGQCPFCSAYTRLVTLRACVGPVELVDARGSALWRERLNQAGVDINDGFVVEHDGQLLVGADALAFIAQASPRVRVWDRLNWRLFRRPGAARAAYPLLRAGRRATLSLLGRKPI